MPEGLRKDTWKMDLPHAPYLFMFAAGEFSIIKDYWKGKEVSYYIEPQFAKDEKAVRDAFPNTVEAIDYFSNLLKVPYPWNKYSQIKLRGFSGAMENTTATAFSEDKQSSAAELLDNNYEPGNIHELFHQWFGNYVTAESWANICLNESFADLSEIIWAEHKFGNDVAGDHFFIKKTENPSYAKDGILAIKEIVTSQKNLSIAPKVILFLTEIKPYKEKLKDKESVEAIEQAIAEINLCIK